TALPALAVAAQTRLVPLITCETVETETPASRATSAIVDTSPPRPSRLPPRQAAQLCSGSHASRSKRLRNRFDNLRGVRIPELVAAGAQDDRKGRGRRARRRKATEHSRASPVAAHRTTGAAPA